MRPSELLIRVHTHRAAVAFMGQPSVAITDARLGADVVRYSFIVVDSHHLLLAGLTGALNATGLPTLDCYLVGK
jgi:hypothetical protein